MKNKTLKLLFIFLVATLSFAFMTSVKAYEWNDENKALTVYCGEEFNTYININDWIEPAEKPANNNQYTITENEGFEILTFATPMTSGWGQNQTTDPTRSYYDRMNVDSSNVGQQILTIRFTPSGLGAQPSDTTLKVKCIASDDLKEVAEALGCVLEDGKATINSENAYTSLDNLTGAQYEKILDAENAYKNLNAAEKAIADGLMTEKLGKTEEEVLQAANDGIERLANEFVDASRLNDDTVTDLNEARKILSDALELGDEFDALSPRTKNKVLAKLSDQTIEFDSWEEVEEECRKEIDQIDAQLFLNNYIELEEGVLNEDKVLAGEQTWENLNDNVKNLINEVLLQTEGIEKTYPELLLRAKANKFLKDNLTKDGKIIIEANNSNYQQIIDAEDDYSALTDEVKSEVNKILVEKGNTTYPDLLKFAQALAPTPKTGDIAMIMGIVLIVSILGLGVTFIVKKK